MIFYVVEAIRERCARFMILTAMVSEICGGQTNYYFSSIDGIHSRMCFLQLVIHVHRLKHVDLKIETFRRSTITLYYIKVNI